jgi:predicted ribosomally synthesized peptide with SipW-like signal peptide
MKNIIKSLLVVVAVASIAGGATYAYFSDTETSTGNTFSAGTLDLKTNNQDGVTHTYSLSNMKPEVDTAQYAGNVTLKNAGSIKGHAWFEVKNIVDTGVLSNYVFPNFLRLGGGGVSFGPDSSLKASESVRVELEDLDPDASLRVGLYVAWPPTATDNDAQGDSLSFDVVFHLDQIP